MQLKIQAKRLVWTENFCCVFKVKTPFSIKFIPRSVDATSRTFNVRSDRVRFRFRFRFPFRSFYILFSLFTVEIREEYFEQFFFYCCNYQNDVKQKFLKSLPQKSHHQTVAQLPIVTATARNASPAVRNTRILGKRERKKEIKQTN